MIGFLKPAPAIAPLEGTQVDHVYRQQRRRVFIGIFLGYVFGSALAGTGVGWIADGWGWNGVFLTMVACCVLTIVFSAMTLGHTAESGTR